MTAILLATGTASAVELGSFPYKTSKDVSGEEASYSIGLVNPGNSTVEAWLETEKSENYSVESPGRIEIEPGSIESSPAGEGWYDLGNGSYIKVEKLSFRVEAPERRETNSLEIPVALKAGTRVETGEGATSQLVHVREHVFEMNIQGEPPEKDTETEWNTVKPEKENQTSLETPEINVSGENLQNYKPEQSQKPDKGGKNLTIALTAGILVLLAYLYTSW